MTTLSTSTIKAADQTASLETRLSRLASLGLLTLPTRQTRQKPKPIKISGPPVSEAILDNRQ